MGDYNKGYRTLTVDLKTYELLEEICSIDRSNPFNGGDQSQEGNPTARGGSCIT